MVIQSTFGFVPLFPLMKASDAAFALAEVAAIPGRAAVSAAAPMLVRISRRVNLWSDIAPLLCAAQRTRWGDLARKSGTTKHYLVHADSSGYLLVIAVLFKRG